MRDSAVSSGAAAASDAGPALTAGLRRVRLRFRAEVRGEPFGCGQTYASSAEGAPRLAPVDLRFFVRDVWLARAEDGGREPLSIEARPPWQLESVALIDFETASGRCGAGTSEINLELTGHVPQGRYSGVSFENGVPPELNHADPASLPPPLQAGGMHWGWLMGYRFLMAEVAAEGEAGDVLPGSALFHLGSTACSGSPAAQTITCSAPNRNRVQLDGFDPDQDEIVVDVGALFEGVDLNAVTTCHSSGEACAPFLERVGIDPSDGSASGGQVLYRMARAQARL